MQKIRHDYKNIILAVAGLIQQDRKTEALELLRDFSSRMTKDEPLRYCSNPVINIILNEKNRICQERGIRFETDILIDQPLRIPDLDLAIVLGNIMDNAIRSSGDCEEGSRWIRLSIRILQNQFILTAGNSCMPNPDKRIYGSGFGQQNIRDIAAKNHGVFRVQESSNSEYRCMLVLENNPEIPEESEFSLEEPELQAEMD